MKLFITIFRDNLETETAIFKSEKLEISNINGKTYVINSSLNYTVVFPNNLLDPLSYSAVFVNSIIWKVSPVLLYPYEEYGIASSVISLFLVDNHREVIPISSKTIILTHPSNIIDSSLKDDHGCLSYNFTFEEKNIKESE